MQKRRPFASHALCPAVEKSLQRVERNPDLHTLDELLAELRRIAPTAFSETMSAGEGQICSDRAERVKLLSKRARLGIGLFYAEDVVHLPPDPGHTGRHHSKRRHRPQE